MSHTAVGYPLAKQTIKKKKKGRDVELGASCSLIIGQIQSPDWLVSGLHRSGVEIE